MRFVRLVFVCLFASLAVNQIIAQGLVDPYARALQRIKSETRIDSLIQFQKNRQAYSLKRKALAEDQARRMGWMIREVDPDGRVVELIDLDEDGKPVYVSTSNLAAAQTISTNLVWPSGPLGLNLTGMGLTAGEWDAGRVRLSHVEFQGRAVQGDGNATNDSHATHVAGTIVAAGINPSAIGGAYQANLRAFDWNNDSAEMAAEAASGMLISNHSYGHLAGWAFQSGSWHWYGTPTIDPRIDWKFGFYNTTCQNWDYIARQAPYYLIMKAAGNDRSENHSGLHKVWDNGWVDSTDPRNPDGQYDCLPTYSNAKNIMTVGAVNDLTSGWVNAAGVSMSTFSSWGPTDDGRIKPDIVANGVNVFSTDRNNDTHYSNKSGTSMATPSATGSALLLQQHYHNRFSQFMRASTLKGLIIHTADEAGRPGPDYSFGWGLMNTAKAAQHISDNQVHTHILEESIAQGQIFEMQVYSDGTAPLIATICWTDVPGLPHAAALNNRNPKLVNDLDLRITAGPSTWTPYVLDPENPTANATTGDNTIDNVEQVRIQTPVAGYYTIRITHKGNLVDGPQVFSLLISRISCYAAILPTYDQSSCQNNPLTLLANSATSNTYQWFLDGNPIAGATSAHWQPVASGRYSLEVQNGSCAALSLEREITIDPVTSGGFVSGSVGSVCYGNNAVTLTLTGHTGRVIRWESSVDAWTTSNTLDFQSTLLHLNNLTEHREYRVIVQSGVCPPESSSTFEIVVVGNGGEVSSSGTVCQGDNSGMLQLTGHTGSIVGWETSTDDWLTATFFSNLTNQFNYSNLVNDTRFRAVLTESPCPTIYSKEAIIGITPLLDVQSSLIPEGPICVSEGGVQLMATYTENFPYNQCDEYVLNNANYVAYPHDGINVFSTAVDDAVSSAIPIGFTFNFFCQTYNEVYVSSNGFISFTPTADDGCCSGEPIPQLDVHSNLIAGCWTDNRLMSNNDVKYQTLGLAPNRRFVISFGGTYQYYAANDLSFQIVLHESTGDVEIVHINIPNNSSFQRTVGIENTNQTKGLTPPGMNASNNWSSVGTTFRFRPLNSSAQISWNWSNPGNGFYASSQQAVDPLPPTGSSTYYLEVKHNLTGCTSKVSLPFQVDPLTDAGSLGTDLTVCKGSHTTTLNLTGSNGNVIRWESSTDSWNSFQALNHTSTQFEFQNLTQPTAFRSVSKSGMCPEETTDAIVIQLDEQPIGGVVLGSVTVCTGVNSGFLTLSAFAGNVIGWEFSTDNWLTSTQVPQTTDVIHFQDLIQSTQYRAVVGNGICPPVFSLPATVEVDQLSVGGVVSSSATVCAGNNSLTLELTGHTGKIIGWEFSTDNWTTVLSVDHTASSYVVSDLSQSSAFRAVVQNGICNSAYSIPATIYVDHPSVSGTLSQDLTLCSGQNSAILTVGGYTGDLIQWERSLDGWQTYEVVNNTTDQLQLLNETQPYAWRVRTQNGVCSSITSNPIQLTLDLPSLRGVLSSNQIVVCTGSNSTELQLTGHRGTVLNWNVTQINPYISQSLPANGASTTLNNLMSNTLVFAIVQNGVCPPVTSNGISIQVRPTPNPGTLVGDATHCFGFASGTLQLTGYSGTLLDWERSLDGGQSWHSLGYGQPAFNYSQLIQTTMYRVKVNNHPCQPVYSNAVTVHVIPKTLAGHLTADQTLCEGASAQALQISGSNGNVIAWERSIDNGISFNQVATNTHTFDPNPITQSSWYRAVVQQSTCAPVRTHPVRIEIVVPPIVGTLSSSQPICKLGQVSLFLSGGSGQITWESSSDQFLQSKSVSNNAFNYTTPPLTNTTWYRVRVSRPYCPDVLSNIVQISVVDSSESGFLTAPQVVCSNQPFAEVLISGHRGDILSWEMSTDDWVTSLRVSNTTNPLLLPVSTLGTGFRAQVQNGPCPAVQTMPIRVEWQLEPSGGELSIALDEADLSADCSSTGGQLSLSNYRGRISHWEYSFDGGVSWTTLSHTLSAFRYNALHHGALFRVAVVEPGCDRAYSSWQGVNAGFGSVVQVINGCGTGTIHVRGIGGVDPYGYFLQPLAGIQNPAGTFTQVPPGNYHVYVRDGRFCYHYNIVQVTGLPDPPLITQVRLNSQGRVLVNWNPLPAPQSVQYQLRFRLKDDLQWQFTGWFVSNQRAFVATAGQTYEIQVRGRCSTTQALTMWSGSAYFLVPATRETLLSKTNSFKLTLYPNPTSNHFWLAWFDSPALPVEVSLYNLYGALVWTKTQNVSEQVNYRFDLPSLAAGVYMLQVRDEWGLHNLKLYIQ